MHLYLRSAVAPQVIPTAIANSDAKTIVSNPEAKLAHNPVTIVNHDGQIVYRDYRASECLSP